VVHPWHGVTSWGHVTLVGCHGCSLSHHVTGIAGALTSGHSIPSGCGTGAFHFPLGPVEGMHLCLPKTQNTTRSPSLYDGTWYLAHTVVAEGPGLSVNSHPHSDGQYWSNMVNLFTLSANLLLETGMRGSCSTCLCSGTLPRWNSSPYGV
jgi:hypothetical protein